MKQTFAILDTNAIINHSFFSGKDPDANLIEGKLVNTPGYAIQVLLERYIIPILGGTPLNHVIAVHDSGKHYRLTKNPEYQKARRDKEATPDTKSVGSAIKLAKELFGALGIPQASLLGEEADDVIAYLATSLPGEKHIYTMDGDLIALARDPSVVVFQKLEPKTDYKGVEPRFVTLFKSLCGDTSDGYSGVKGFGPAKWEMLNTKQLEFLDYVVNHRADDEVVANFKLAYDRSDNKALKLIYENKQQWVHSYHEMAKMHPELVDAKPIEAYTDQNGELAFRPGDKFNRLKWDKQLPDAEKLKEVLARSGADYHWDKLKGFMPKQTLVTPNNLDLTTVTRQILNSRLISLDWETWQVPNENFKKANQGKEFVDMLGSTISGMGITCGENLEHTYYFQFDHSDTENNLSKDILLTVLDVIPANMPVVAHNMYFEISVLMSEFKVTLPIMYDTMIMHTHIDELGDSHGLKDLTKRYLGYDQTHYADVIDKGMTMRDYTGQHVFRYGADDPLVTAHLFDLFQLHLHLEHTWEFVRDNEFPAVQLLAEAYVEGVSFDFSEVERQRAEDQEVYDINIARMRELLRSNPVDGEELEVNAWNLYKADINPNGDIGDEAISDLVEVLRYSDLREIQELGKNGKLKKAVTVGTALNLDSPKQMQYLFYGTLGLPIRIRDFKVSETRKNSGLEGTPQVNTDMIDEAIFSGDVTGWKLELLECFRDAKKCATRVKLFYNKFPLWEHPKDGNVHPRFNSCGTESRRPTGGSPNLLQLAKTGEGVKVRRCIVPNRNKGHDLIVAIDWAAEELRLIAHESGDVEMTACYLGEELKDIHSQVAAQIMKTDYATFITNLKSSDDKVSKKYKDARKTAKGVIFGSNYGIGASKLARSLHVSEDEARFFLDAKRQVYSGVENWKEEVKETVENDGYVKTMYGSRKHLFEHYTKSDAQMKSYYSRSSVNYIIQGTAADYLKKVLSDLYKMNTFQRYNATFSVALYDELIFSVHSSNAVALIKEVYGVMIQGIPGMEIPMLASPSLGVNFGDQIEILQDENEVMTDELIQIAINKALG